jgi:hypothetical protein
MGRLLLGILKGGVLGVAMGYLAGRAGVATGAVAIIVYGAIGALVGLVCGRPFWRQETIWTPILKAIFGFGLGIGAAFAGRKWLGGVHLPIAFIPGATEHALPDVAGLFGPAIGMVYGAFVELDDASGTDTPKSVPPKSAPPKTVAR